VICLDSHVVGGNLSTEPGIASGVTVTSSVAGVGGGSSHSGDGVRDSHGDLSDLVDWGVHSLAHGLHGVGPGLVSDGLGDGLVSSHWSVDLLGAVSWDVLEDGLSDVVGLDDGGGLVGGNWGGDVGVGGLSHGVGQGGDLGSDLSEGVSLSSGVGKVATQPVVLDGSRVMSRSSDQVRGSSQGSGGSHSSGGHGNCSRAAESDQSGEKQEGVHGGC